MSMNTNNDSSTTSVLSLAHTDVMVREAVELASRVGATAIVGVGDAAALNVAKAVHSRVHSSNTTADTTAEPPLLLVPDTYEACLVAAAPHTPALIWNSTEQVLQAMEGPYLYQNDSKDNDTADLVVVAIPVDSMFVQHHNRSRVVALLAVMALALDQLLQAPATAAFNLRTVQYLEQALEFHQTTAAINTGTTDKDTRNMAAWLVSAGTDLVSFGLPITPMGASETATSSRSRLQLPRCRSGPLALAASVMAQDGWSQYDMLTLMASCLPALMSVLEERIAHKPNDVATTRLHQVLVASNIVSTAPMVVTNETMAAVLLHMEETRLHWNCRDAPKDYLQRMLQHHVLV
jgi:hypothetical protein